MHTTRSNEKEFAADRQGVRLQPPEILPGRPDKERNNKSYLQDLSWHARYMGYLIRSSNRVRDIPRTRCSDQHFPFGKWGRRRSDGLVLDGQGPRLSPSQIESLAIVPAPRPKAVPVTAHRSRVANSPLLVSVGSGSAIVPQIASSGV